MLQYIILLAFIGASAGLAWFLIAHDHGEKEPVVALWLAALAGVIGAVGASLLEAWLVPSDKLLPGGASTALLGASLSVGLIEEICKFTPLAVFLYRQRYFNERTDGVIYFALAGLGFGLPENILYTLQFGSKAGTVRLFLTPLFHAAATGTVGYFLAKRKLAGKPVLGIIIPLLAVAVLHGLYDFGLIRGSGVSTITALLITLSLSATLFVLFQKATELDQEKGISMVGHNSFCRSCGRANPQHHLYCVQCGKNA